MLERADDFFDDRGPFAEQVRSLANRAGCLITLQHVATLSPRDTARVMLDVLAHVRQGVGDLEEALTAHQRYRTRIIADELNTLSDPDLEAEGDISRDPPC